MRKIKTSENVYNPPDQFWGVSYQYTFYRERHLQVGALLRLGFVENEFLTHVPSLVFDFIINDYWKVSTRASVRGEQASYGLSLVFNIPFKKEFPYRLGKKR